MFGNEHSRLIASGAFEKWFVKIDTKKWFRNTGAFRLRQFFRYKVSKSIYLKFLFKGCAYSTVHHI